MRIEEVKARSLLSKRIEVDGWFHSNYSMNLYRGCQFACAYCDGMSEYYHVDEFQTHIRVKVNAPEVLRRELKKLGYRNPPSLLDFTDSRIEYKKPIIGISGGVSDSYQQAEKEYELTRKILEVILEHELPLFILTKSDLILRDIDILKEINEKAFASVCFSITQMDELKKQQYEPTSSSTEERFQALKTLREAGIKGGVMAMPMIPYICDNIENIQKLIEAANKAKTEFVLFGGLTLKPGRQKRYFLDTVKRYAPEKLDQIKKVYSNDNRYGQPDRNKVPRNVMKLGYAMCRKVGVNPRSVRHQCPEEYVSNHRVLQILLDLQYWMSMFLGRPRNDWKDIQTLAVNIEKGIPDLQNALKQGKLKSIIGLKLHSAVSQILQTGSCDLQSQIIETVDRLSNREYEKVISGLS